MNENTLTTSLGTPDFIQFDTVASGTDIVLTFEVFDEERYNLTYSNGAVQILREANLVFSADRKSVTLKQLSQNNH